MRALKILLLAWVIIVPSCNEDDESFKTQQLISIEEISSGSLLSYSTSLFNGIPDSVQINGNSYPGYIIRGDSLTVLIPYLENGDNSISYYKGFNKTQQSLLIKNRTISNPKQEIEEWINNVQKSIEIDSMSMALKSYFSSEIKGLKDVLPTLAPTHKYQLALLMFTEDSYQFKGSSNGRDGIITTWGKSIAGCLVGTIAKALLKITRTQLTAIAVYAMITAGNPLAVLGVTGVIVAQNIYSLHKSNKSIQVCVRYALYPLDWVLENVVKAGRSSNAMYFIAGNQYKFIFNATFDQLSEKYRNDPQYNTAFTEIEKWNSFIEKLSQYIVIAKELVINIPSSAQISGRPVSNDMTLQVKGDGISILSKGNSQDGLMASFDSEQFGESPFTIILTLGDIQKEFDATILKCMGSISVVQAWDNPIIYGGSVLLKLNEELPNSGNLSWEGSTDNGETWKIIGQGKQITFSNITESHQVRGIFKNEPCPKTISNYKTITVIEPEDSCKTKIKNVSMSLGGFRKSTATNDTYGVAITHNFTSCGSIPLITKYQIYYDGGNKNGQSRAKGQTGGQLNSDGTGGAGPLYLICEINQNFKVEVQVTAYVVNEPIATANTTFYYYYNKETGYCEIK